MPLGDVFVDQTGHEIELQAPPSRIVSLVPSQTELLSYFELDEKVCGITKFCIHPGEWRREKTIVGGTKTAKIEVVRSLEPDLIIANKEENERSQIEALREEFPVWTSDIYNLEDNLEMINQVGQLCGRQEAANSLCAEVMRAFDNLKPSDNRTAVYLIWDDPIMAIGSQTYIHAMLQRCGIKNALPGTADMERYPVLTADQLAEIDPDLLLLSSEPFPFAEKHLPKYKALCPRAEVLLVDGEMFSWYGARSRLAPAYFESITQSS